MGLYLLRLSYLLEFDGARVMETTGTILLAYFGGIIAGWAVVMYVASAGGYTRGSRPRDLEKLDDRLRILLVCWAAITLVEIVVSRGVPLLWLLTDSAKIYFDFGIPSIHGLLNSLLLSLSLISFYLFAERRQLKYLALPIFVTVWSVIVISRQLLIVNLMQITVLYLSYYRVRLRTVIRLLVGAFTLVLVFGYIGDARSGGDAFLALAQPTENYPLWLPSGFLWVYMYITTPLNNLVNTVLYGPVSHGLTVANTVSLLFPSVVRNVIFTEPMTRGTLVTDAFNVSTAFIGPYQDMGMLGIIAYAFMIGLVATILWNKRTAKGRLYYSIMAQCLAISIFYNTFFYLPVIFQFVWIALIFAPRFGTRAEPAQPRVVTA